jgi:hypothetical protein
MSTLFEDLKGAGKDSGKKPPHLLYVRSSHELL